MAYYVRPQLVKLSYSYIYLTRLLILLSQPALHYTRGEALHSVTLVSFPPTHSIYLVLQTGLSVHYWVVRLSLTASSPVQRGA
jgi:hypothetical protein